MSIWLLNQPEEPRRIKEKNTFLSLKSVFSLYPIIPSVDNKPRILLNMIPGWFHWINCFVSFLSFPFYTSIISHLYSIPSQITSSLSLPQTHVCIITHTNTHSSNCLCIRYRYLSLQTQVYKNIHISVLLKNTEMGSGTYHPHVAFFLLSSEPVFPISESLKKKLKLSHLTI